jgi:PAS domain S-box-containing protein
MRWRRHRAPRGTLEGWLSNREQELAAVLEAAPDAVVVSDQDGKIVFVNDQARAIFGYPGAGLVGRQIETLVPIRLRAGHVVHREGYAAAPRTRAMGVATQLTAVRADGGEFPVDVSLSTLDLDAGRVVIAFARDVTEARRLQQERRELEFELLRSDRPPRSAPVGSVAIHDVNNFLAVILANANLALAVVEPGSPGYHELVDIERAARQAGEVTRRIGSD